MFVEEADQGLVECVSVLLVDELATLPIVLIAAADGITGLWPELFHVLAWSLGPLAAVLLVDGVLVSVWPLVATAAWTVALLGVAARVLQRTEL